MTREDLIPLIQESVIVHPNANPFDFRLCELATIEHFAKLVAEREREACAAICDAFEFSPAANAIRARGNP